MTGKQINDGGPAFPVPGNVAWDRTENTALAGMSLRDKFAEAALRQSAVDYGETGDGQYNKGDRRLPYACEALGSREDIIARQAYRYADAMLRAREEGKA